MKTYQIFFVALGVLTVVGSGVLSASLGIAHMNGSHAYNNNQSQSRTQNESVQKIDHQSYVAYKDKVIKKNMAEGDYACCLASPCASCLELDPYHGEGAACSCLEDIVNGEGPCDECAGGILSGRGNPYLVSYFVDALTAKFGESHRATIEQMISEAYEA